MKKSIARLFITRLPIPERRVLVEDVIKDIVSSPDTSFSERLEMVNKIISNCNSVEREKLIRGLIGEGKHVHGNPRRKEKAA